MGGKGEGMREKVNVMVEVDERKEGRRKEGGGKGEGVPGKIIPVFDSFSSNAPMKISRLG